MVEVIRSLTLWDNISSGAKVPENINVLVELPKGSLNRYSYDRRSGAFVLKGVLAQPLPVADLGIIPQSLYDDGLPLSAVVLMGEPSFPGCIVEARPVGLLKIRENGSYSDKVLAVPLSDPRYSDVSESEDVDAGTLGLVSHFFAHGRDLEGARIEVVGWRGADAAKKAVEHGVGLYKRKSERV